MPRHMDSQWEGKIQERQHVIIRYRLGNYFQFSHRVIAVNKELRRGTKIYDVGALGFLGMQIAG